MARSPPKIVRIEGQLIADRRNQKFPARGGGQADRQRREHDRLDDPPLGNSGGQQGRQFVESLEQGKRKHRGDQGHDAAGGVEKRKAPIGVVFSDHQKHAAMFFAVGDELLQVRERIDYDVQAVHAAEADQEDLHELAQQVSVEDEHARRRIRNADQEAWVEGIR